MITNNNLVKVLITGCHGTIGQAFIKRCQGKFYVLGTAKEESAILNKDRFAYKKLDITNRKAVKQVFKEFNPRFVVNAAGINCRDICENEKSLCWKVNVDGLNNVIYYSNIINARLIHISDCLVFDGKKGNYSESDRPFPDSYYGKSKLAGENNIRSTEIEWTIIRASLIYGKNSIKNTDNLVDNVIERLTGGNSIEIKKNVLINPTYVGNFVDAIWKIIKLEKTGVFHIAGREIMSLTEFVRKVASYKNYDPNFVSDKNDDNSQRNFGMTVSQAEKELKMRFLNVEEGLKFYFM